MFEVLGIEHHCGHSMIHWKHQLSRNMSREIVSTNLLDANLMIASFDCAKIGRTKIIYTKWSSTVFVCTSSVMWLIVVLE